MAILIAQTLPREQTAGRSLFVISKAGNEGLFFKIS